MAAVVIAGALGVPSAYYRRLAAQLAVAGYAVSTLPARGLDPGTMPPSRRSDWAYRDLVDALAAEVARARDREQPVLVLGHSLGGQLALLAALGDLARTPGGGDPAGTPDGLVLVAAPIPHFRSYGRQSAAILALAASVWPVTAALGYWPRRGFGGPAARTAMRGWARLVRTGDLAATVGMPAAPAVRVPTLAVDIEGDRLAPPATVEALAGYVAPDLVTRWTYRQADSDAPIDHLRWARAAQPVVDRIVAWRGDLATEG